MGWMFHWKQEIHMKLLDSDPSLIVKINSTAILRGTDAERAAYYRSMFSIGAMSHNDIADLEDKNHVPYGDMRWVPANMIPIGDGAEELLEMMAKSKASALSNSEKGPPVSTEQLPDDNKKDALHHTGDTPKGIVEHLVSVAMRKQVKSATRILKRTDSTLEEFNAFLSKFYMEGNFQHYMAEMIQPVEDLAVDGKSVDFTAIIQLHIETSIHDLQAMYGSANYIDEWSKAASETLTLHLLNELGYPD